jgi:hypothetical protein
VVTGGCLITKVYWYVATLGGLDDLGRSHLKLGTEDAVPETASDTETVLVVCEVMRKVVLLQLLVVRRKLLVVKEVVCHIVAGVSEDTTTVGSQSGIPVPKDDSMCEFPERCCKDNEECRWHDEPVLVHGKVMVNPVKKKVEGNGDAVIRKVIIQMEQTPV